jgi:hypothetical protein
MNKVFCVSCGFKILYETSKPKFCSSCGEGVGGTVTASKKEEIEQGDSLDLDIEKLKKGISIEKSKRATSLKEIWSSVTPQEAANPPDDMQRPSHRGPEGKELLDQTLKDCSSSRMRDVDE